LKDAGIHWRIILKFNKNKQSGRIFYWLQEPLKALVNMVMLMICT